MIASVLAIGASAQTGISDNFGKLPLSFEPNHGQSDEAVRFLARGQSYGIFLTKREAVLSLDGRAAPASSKRVRDVVRMSLAGSREKAAPVGEEQLPGTMNYFIGNDRSKWRAGVPTYARVHYPQVYGGVDLFYYGRQGRLEYDFLVAPHADASKIKLRFAGERRLRLTREGDLEIVGRHGAMRFGKPVAYQNVDGERRTVQSAFVIAGKTVQFRIGTYDHARELTIDPVLAYSTYLGGSGGSASVGWSGDEAQAVAVDGSGNAYVAGYAYSHDFPVTSGALQTTNKVPDPTSGSVPATGFVSKLNSSGTALVYSTFLGGSSQDGVTGIAVDASGNTYVTGITSSPDFPVTLGAFCTTLPSGTSAFVTKLNASGSALIYSSYLGGSNSNNARGIAVDAAGNAYVTGDTGSTDFPTTRGAYQTTNKAATNSAAADQHLANAFVTKLSSNGASLVYSTYLGGTGSGLPNTYGWLGDSARAIYVDVAGNAYVAGTAASKDFPVTSGAYMTTIPSGPENTSGSSPFVSKLNASGRLLVYSTYIGGSGNDVAKAIAADPAGNAYITGYAHSWDFPTTKGAFQTTGPVAYSANPSGFVTKLNPSGTALAYSTYLGGSNLNEANAIAVDAWGQASVVGLTLSTDFPVTSGALQTTNHETGSHSNAFLSKLNPVGTGLIYSTYFGGSDCSEPTATYADEANAVALDSSGQAYVAGTACSTDLPVTVGALQMTNKTAHKGGTNAFVAKFNVGTPVAILKSPTNGSALQETSEMFTWTAVAGAHSYALYMGSTPGAYDIAYVRTTSTSALVTGIPDDGRKLYVDVWTVENGFNYQRGYTFYAPGKGTAANMAAPAPGSKWSGSSVTFSWSGGSGISSYELYVGTKPGAHDVAYISAGTANSVTVNNLPTNGEKLYVYLWSLNGKTWLYHGYSYTASGSAAAAEK